MSPSEGLCGCCFASPTHPPPPSYSPGEGDVGLCPAPCWSSWGGSHAGHPGGVPSLRTGDAEHCSHVRSGQWKDMARKVLSSPPFSPPPPPCFFSPSCPSCGWRLWALPAHGLNFQRTGVHGLAGLATQPSASPRRGRRGQHFKGAVAAPTISTSCGARSQPRGVGPPVPPCTSISPG